MKLGQFIESVTEAINRGGLEILDLDIKVEDRLTGEYYDVDEGTINPDRRELYIVVQTEAAAVATGEIDQDQRPLTDEQRAGLIERKRFTTKGAEPDDDWEARMR